MIYLELKRVIEEQIPLMNWENVKLVGKLFSAFCTLLKNYSCCNVTESALIVLKECSHF